MSEAPDNRNQAPPPRLAQALSTSFGAGDLPGAPGTWGSLAALPFAVIAVLLGGQILLMALILVGFVVGVWASGRLAAHHRLEDPQRVVIDEVIGQWLAILPVALDWRYYIVAFVLFRFADITKPWPLKNLERLPGGVGIMADDIGAGVYAGILTWLIAVWLGSTGTLPTLFG
ncbi:MAG: phosphatidylglycerophosphatase A [Alphaproteobacteria bacterium]|nr:phosphatidylglycerophosphatase A [Alphaproteobacteria bacterium]|tara:strand:+ start:60 stop:578 length:519 start_codon:yes stop_codon:yes gene_type:complete